MRIAIVSHGVSDQSLLGGPGRVAAHHALALARRGHAVRIVTTDMVKKGVRASSPTCSELENAELAVKYLSAYSSARWPGSVGPVLVRSLRAEMRKAVRWADLVHAHEWPTPLTQSLRRQARLEGKVCVIQPHGTIAVRRGAKGALHRIYNGRHRPSAGELFVVGSQREAEEVKAAFSVSPTVRQLVNPIPIATTEAGSAQVAVRRASWGFPELSTVILYAHRLTPNKGLDLAIRALATLPHGFCLAVVGEDTGFPSFTARCKALVTELGLESRVRFFGPIGQSEIEETVLAADLFILPARFDTFPLMVLHALACGLPVVLTSTCQCIESIGLCAVIAEPEPASLAAAVGTLDASRIQKLSEAGRRLVANHYSPDAVCAQLEGMYRASLADQIR